VVVKNAAIMKVVLTLYNKLKKKFLREIPQHLMQKLHREFAEKGFNIEKDALAKDLVALRATVSAFNWEFLVQNGVNVQDVPTVRSLLMKLSRRIVTKSIRKKLNLSKITVIVNKIIQQVRKIK